MIVKLGHEIGTHQWKLNLLQFNQEKQFASGRLLQGENET